jgi:hypothetical protein
MFRRTLTLLAVGSTLVLSWVVPSHAAGCIAGTVVLDSLTVAAGETYCLSPTVSTTLEIRNGGNLIVNGTLQAKPANVSVQHRIVFTGVNEAAFAGGGDVPLATDPGLWVQGAGVLDIAGTQRVPWNRTGNDPTWTATDELVTSPITAGDYNNFAPFIKGSTVPTTVAPDGTVYTAEVLNLTRNVTIEGTPTGRAHVHIKSTAPQSIKNAVIRYMGPRKLLPGDTYDTPVPGRSSLHFHRTGDGSRGSLVENVVVRDGGGERGYDIHAAHGVTVRGSIALNTNGPGIGWVVTEESNDTLIEDFVAAKQVPVPSFRGYGLAGIDLPGGTGNILRNSVAVANQGNNTGSGVRWPEMGILIPNVWTTENVISHNNKTDGIYAWQNSHGNHVVTNFVCYLNGRAGVEHGAYVNHYKYVNLKTWGSGVAGIIEHAASNDGIPLLITGGKVDGLRIWKHNQDATIPVEFRDVDLTRPGGFKLVVSELSDGGTKRGYFDLYNTGVEPGDVSVVGMVATSVYRVKRADGTAFRIKPDGTTEPIVF